MSTYTQTMYHIVFGTYGRKPTLLKENRPELFKFIWGIVKNKKCHLYRINGVEDHIHILTDLHPTVTLADLIKDVKVSSSKFVKEKKMFPSFNGWQKGYGAFNYAFKQRNFLIEYIKNQENHHKKVSFREEFIMLLKEHGIDYDEKYLFD
ncbi:IS200/IS605 family transposase [soil metagenome]